MTTGCATHSKSLTGAWGTPRYRTLEGRAWARASADVVALTTSAHLTSDGWGHGPTQDTYGACLGKSQC
eukprot:365043-Chlamydomonas_euryale.AAC.10